jgi:hypothetical protein
MMLVRATSASLQQVLFWLVRHGFSYEQPVVTSTVRCRGAETHTYLIIARRRLAWGEVAHV